MNRLILHFTFLVAGFPVVTSFTAPRPFGSRVPGYQLPTCLQASEEENLSERLAESFRQFESLADQAHQDQTAELQSIAESLQTMIANAKGGADAVAAEQASSFDSSPQQEETTDNFLADPTVEGEEDMPMMGAPEIAECDVCIVGGGPAGCACALYTARAGLRTVILDKNPAVGALAITSHIANYPGVDKSLTGEELLGSIRQQAIDYGTDYRRAQVFMIDMEEDDPDSEEIGYSKTVYTPDAIVKTRTLVLATGAMGRVADPFPGEDTYLGAGVSYCATCDGAFYRDAEVAVKGMNLEAIEEATFLAKFAKTVHWVTPSRPRPNQDDHVKELLACGNVKKWPLTRLISVEGDVTGVTGIKIKQKESDEAEILPVEGVFIYAGGGGGSKPITDFVSSNTIEFKENGGVVVNEEMETNIKGVFAIGDIRNTSNKQVVVAASDGCIAAMSIDKYLRKRKQIRVDWIHK